MIAVAVERHTRTVERGKSEGAFGKIDVVIGPGADAPEDLFCFCARCHDSGITIPGMSGV